MSTKRPDHQRLTHRGGDDAPMEPFTLPLPRTLFTRLFGRNPLLRASDRVEALIAVVAVTVSLVAVPIAATVGTAVHESRSRVYAEQAQSRRAVTATAIGDQHPRRDLDKPTVTVPARWFDGGAEHTGDVVAPLNVKIGDEVEIWVDDKGSVVDPPQRTAHDEALAFAIATWWAVTLSAVAMFAAVRIAVDRARYARWQRDFDSLIEHG